MAGLIGFVMLLAVPAFGFSGASWSWVFLFAAIGFFAYWMMRPLLFSCAEQESIAFRSVRPIAMLVGVTYVAQLITWAMLFLAGRGIALLLG